MKPTFLRLVVFIVALALGLAVTFSMAGDDVSNELIAPVENGSVFETPPYVDYFVISVPTDGEFYIGKRRVEPAQISDIVTQSFSSIPLRNRFVSIKSGRSVKFESLALVIDEVKRAGIVRIEFRIDKKKLGDKDVVRR